MGVSGSFTAWGKGRSVAGLWSCRLSCMNTWGGSGRLVRGLGLSGLEGELGGVSSLGRRVRSIF